MKITVYLTGGIAAYKAVYVIRQLEKDGHEIRVAMTKNAEKFITSNTLAALTKHKVLDTLWGQTEQEIIPHVRLAQWTELALVVPASADFIAKMANGIADDAATTTILATSAHKLVVPAMNDQMWLNPATQRNIATLRADGIHIMEPANGLLAEGYQGKGRMPEPDEIVKWVNRFIQNKKKLVGKKIIVTAGGTREIIDPVRYIGNNSSGKMGIAIAKAARDAGAEVVLIYGQVKVDLPEGVKLIQALSTAEMQRAVQKEFTDAQALFMAAAVADWRPLEAANHKLKKKADVNELNITLVKTPDILKNIVQHKQEGQIIVGFAAETNDLLQNAKRKLMQKGVDYIIANNVAEDKFGSDLDKVTILQANKKPEVLPRMSKNQIAAYLITLI